MMRFHQVSRLPALLERFPQIPVALDHVAVPRLREGPPYDDLQPLFYLVRFPHLYLKFSSETIYAARQGRSTVREFFRRLLDHFGPERMMWGSNFPATHDRSLKEPLAMVRDELSFLSEEDQSLDNAATVITRLHRGEKRLVFCDSRADVESLSKGLRRLGVDTYLSHSSLSREERVRAETAFAQNSNCVIVSTSTLELGIDVGDLDRVIQVGARGRFRPSCSDSAVQAVGQDPSETASS